MSGFTVAWIVLFALGFMLEGVALWAGRGTLSGHVWHLMGTAWGKPLVLSFFCWLAWHWMIEPVAGDALRRTYSDDGLIAAAVALLAIMSGRRKA